jgi:mutator protein MutT
MIRPDLQVCHLLLVRGQGEATEVLLLRRSNTGHGDGTWDGVAGRVEPGESAADAAVREADEEVGVQVQRNDLAEVHREMSEHEPGPSVQHIFYIVRQWSGDPVNREPDWAELLGWYALDATPGPVIPAVAAALKTARSRS